METSQLMKDTSTSEPRSFIKSHKKLIILIILLFAICAVSISVLILSRLSTPVKQNELTTPISQTTSSPISMPVTQTNTTPTTPAATTDNYNPTLPTGWSLENITDCNLQVPLPPASGEFYENLTDTYKKWTISPKSVANSSFKFDAHGAFIHFATFEKGSNSQLGSDNPADTVNISCADRVYSKDEILSTFDSYFNSTEHFSDFSFGDSQEKWGEKVEVLINDSVNFGRSTQFVLNKNNRTYFISYHNGNTNTAEKIATNIVFKN